MQNWNISHKRSKSNELKVKSTIELEGIFVQIALVPNTDWLGDEVELTRIGEIIVDKHGSTSIPGVFAVSDCTDSPY